MDAAVKAVFAALIWHTPELLPLLVSLFTIFKGLKNTIKAYRWVE